MMKKFWGCLLTICMIAGVCGCVHVEPTQPTKEKDTQITTEVKNTSEPEPTTQLETETETETETREPYNLTEDSFSCVEGHEDLYEMLNIQTILEPGDASYCHGNLMGLMGTQYLIIEGNYYYEPTSPEANGMDIRYCYISYDLETKSVVSKIWDPGQVSVMKNYFMVFDYESKKLVVYNPRLEKQAEYQIDMELSGAEFYCGDELFPLYCNDYLSEDIYKVSNAGEALLFEKIELPGYYNRILNVSSDGSELICTHQETVHFSDEIYRFDVEEKISLGTVTDHTERWIAKTNGFESYEVNRAQRVDNSDCYLFSYSNDSGDQIVVLWNAKNAIASGNDLAHFEEMGELDDFAMSIPQGNTPEYEELYRMAQEIGEKHGVRIYLGDQVPERISSFNLGRQTSAEDIRYCLEVLEKNLDVYPEGFFEQLLLGDYKEFDIFIACGITSEAEGMISNAGGFASSEGYHRILVLDANEWDFLYNTIHHEIFHAMDSRIEEAATYHEQPAYSYETWMTYNPSGFSYLDSYVGYEYNETYQTYMDYFLSDYSTTYASEDRAVIFGNAMYEYFKTEQDDAYVMVRDREKICAKLTYICECIRDSFDTTGWSDVMPWEKFISIEE